MGHESPFFYTGSERGCDCLPKDFSLQHAHCRGRSRVFQLSFDVVKFFWFSWHLLLLKDHWMDNFEIRTDKTLKNKIKFFKGKRTFFTMTQNEIWVMGPYRKGNLIWHSFALGSRSSNVESAGPGLLLPSKAMILQTPGARFGGLSIAMENEATFKTRMTVWHPFIFVGE